MSTIPAELLMDADQRRYVESLPPAAPSAADALLAELRSYLHLSPADEGRLWVNLAAAVSADLPDHEAPLWVMNVAASSGGKNEVTDLLRGVRQRELSDVTLAGLLTFKTRTRTNPDGDKETYSVAGGILPELEGQRALVVVKDMSSVLGADARSGTDRANLFACLREVFDGSYARDNAEGSYVWRGKVTIVANVTFAVDRYAAHMSALGTRWTFFRQPPRTRGDMAAVSDMIRRVPREQRRAAKERATEVAAALVVEARRRVPDEVPDEVADAIGAASRVAAYGRRNVPREGPRREVSGMVEEEDSPRLEKQLVVLARCLYALGLDDGKVLQLCRWVAVGSMPFARFLLIEAVRREPGRSGRSAARWAGIDQRVAAYALEDLRLIGLLRSDPDEAEVGQQLSWFVAEEWEDDFELAFGLPADSPESEYEVDDQG